MRKLVTMAGVGMLTLLLGVPVVVCAQDEKPPREEPRAEPKAEPRQPQDARPPRQDEARPPKQDEAKPPKHEEKQQRPADARQPERPENGAGARPAGGKSGHIPDDKFRASFGRQHTVVIRQPVIVEGQPRFQYGGYWFVISDPWPADWSYTDDCYIDYVDGDYFLFDLLHPGMRIALFVVM
jgi:hypothetical protein